MRKLPRLSDLTMSTSGEFHIGRLVTDVGLYEAVLIDAAGIRVIDRAETKERQYIAVSKDVEALNILINTKTSEMLPCPQCKQNQPFIIDKFYNPQKVIIPNPPRPMEGAVQPYFAIKSNPVYAMSDINSESQSTKHSVFDLPRIPNYKVGQNYLISVDKQLFPEEELERYKYNCALRCVDDISTQLSEIRRDFYCTLDSNHYGFVDYILYAAVNRDELPPILQQYEDKKRNAPSLTMTDAEMKAWRDFDKLKTCLIMEKVGQYPSMADIQMFDVEKYKTVLNKEQFREFKMAIGLYSSGVGCGSFVYLRRIFEGLVREEELEASKSDDWNYEEYRSRDFNKKIAYLESLGHKIIPDELNNIKTRIYGVLSKGVHSSSDQECIELFPIMKYIIEELLDHKIAEKKRKDKIKNLESVLGKI